MSEQPCLWPNIEDQFFDDIERVQDRCGPWDLVLFTGDLTQSGRPEQFDRVDELLMRLFERLETFGPRPLLLAVPGNHDLVRPRPNLPAVEVLRLWDKLPHVRSSFWVDRDSEYKKIVDDAFLNYQNWWRRHEVPLIRGGFLPGDFSATVAKGTHRLGIIGLNSAFLQLDGGDHEGRLAAHSMQLQAVTGGDAATWARSHDACLLLTHHPPEWLNEESRRALHGEIAPPGRFVVHLFGHMHGNATRSLALAGAETRRCWQATSLFGLEGWGDREERRHGYAAGRIELSGSTGTLRLWPRLAMRHQAGHWHIVPDHTFSLENDDGTRSEEFACHRARAAVKSRIASPVSSMPRRSDVYHFEKGLDKYYLTEEVAKGLFLSKRGRGLVRPSAGTTGPAGHEIRLSLEARGLFGLYEVLTKLEGFDVNSRMSIEKLFKVGSQSIVYLAHDKSNDRPVICKIPFVDYAHPARISMKDIERAREHLLEENQSLATQLTPFFPQHVALEIATCRLHPESRPSIIRDRELFLFEEFVAGPTVEEETWMWHRSSPPDSDAIGKLLTRVAADVLEFQSGLYDEGRGYYYTDLCPRNMVIDSRTGRVRHVDAGSILPVDHNFSRRLTVAYTKPFLPPPLSRAVERGVGCAFSPNVCLTMLGRSLFAIATNSSPHDAEDLDERHPLLMKLPEPIRLLVLSLSSDEIGSFSDASSVVQEVAAYLGAAV